MKNKLALIFDFDDTLTPDSTSIILKANDHSRKDIENFWNVDVSRLVEHGWERTLAWLHLFLKKVRSGDIQQKTSIELKQFGRTLRPYPGLRELLDDLQKSVSKYSEELQTTSHGK